MEDDDEFGELYTDVLQPTQMSSGSPQPPVQSTSHPISRSIDINDRIPSDDEEILYGSKSSSSLKFDQSDQNSNFNKTEEAAVKTEKISTPVDSGGRVLEDDNKGDVLQIKDETMEENFGIEDTGMDEFVIPGLSSSGDRNVEGGDDWDDSDSEDDLQIVLNDDNTVVGMMGMDVGGVMNEEDGDDLVIVTGNVDPNHHVQPMEDLQNWGEDVNQTSEGGGERNELLGGDTGKGDGGAAVAPKMGYYNQFHSQFKYVRPGAAPMLGAGPVAVGGAPGQVRPPGGQLSFAGRGRGDWRPTGIKNIPSNMQKNLYLGYGVPGWGNNGAGRGFGTGLDFTLPSHKTIFEVDIDGFEEKPWRLQGIDISDFFNFGMNEESWKEYCKQLEQHRLEATMQSKIRVYESGRTEQEYDPDLPPELAAAAAAGHDISSENRNIRNIDVRRNLANGSAHAQMELPTGKAIQVETGFGERLPSIDTRPPRMRDSDSIIEIVLQRSSSPDHESVQGDDVSEHLEDLLSKGSKKEGLEIEDEIGSEVDCFDKPQSYNNGRKGEVSGRRAEFIGSTHDVSVTNDRVPHFSDTEAGDHLDSRNRTFYPSKKHNSPHNHIERPMKRTVINRSPRLTDNQIEESTESVDRHRRQSPASSSLTLGIAKNRILDQNDAVKEDFVVIDGDKNDDNALKDEKLKHKMKKQNPIQMGIKGMEDQYSHRKWESNKGYRSDLKSENYDRKKLKETDWVWIEDMMKKSHRARKNERSDKIDHRSRKPLENGGWKGDHDRDTIPTLKAQTRHHTIPEGMHSKREEPVHSHRESSCWRKRERDDNIQREKVERQREREKDNSWVGHTRVKEDFRTLNKGYPFKDTGREQVPRRENLENETFSRHRGQEDAYLQGNKINNEERISSRHERGYGGGMKDMHGVQDKKHKETLKKGNETDGAIHNSVSTSRKNREDNIGHKSERASLRGNIEQRASDQKPVARKSSKKHKEKETASSEDEHQESKKGRSKLERWTSHKERDYSLDIKETDIKHTNDGSLTKLIEESIKPSENLVKSEPLVEEKKEYAKPPEDKHLDTVEKLKKRSERFKLPMPSEKEALAVKKIENGSLLSARPETRPESEVKPERPARKRRWTSG